MRLLFRLARFATYPLFAITPRRHRFGLAMRIARLAAPVAWRILPRHLRALNDSVSMSLWLMTSSLNRSGIAFDVPIDVANAEVVDEAQRLGRGLLLVTGHFVLNTMPIPWLRRRGWRVHTVRSAHDPLLVVPGTRERLAHLVPSPNMLVEVRTALRNGEVVIMTVDSTEPVAKGFTIETPFSAMHVSDASLRLATRCGASIAYLATRASRRGLAATITPGDVALRTMFEQWYSRADSSQI